MEYNAFGDEIMEQPNQRQSRSMSFRPKPPTHSPAPFQAPVTRAYTKTANGDLETPETECWDNFAYQPLRHMLLCGHHLDTEVPQPCGPDCKTNAFADSKVKGENLRCWKGHCGVQRRRQAKVSIFMPKKKPTKNLEPTPMRGKKTSKQDSNELFVPQGDRAPRVEKRKTRLPSERKMSSKALSNALTKYAFGDEMDKGEEELVRLNAMAEADPALQALIANQDVAGLRRKSKLHPGYALRSEREDEDMASSLHKGVSRLRGLGGNTRAVHLAGFSLPDLPVGETTTLRRSHRLQLIEEAEEVAGDQYNSEDDLDGSPKKLGTRGIHRDGTYFEAQMYCVICQVSSFEAEEYCKGCDKAFHPSCLGVESVDRCADCAEVRFANEELANRTFSKSTKLNSIADIRSFNLKRRNERKEAAEKSASQQAAEQSEDARIRGYMSGLNMPEIQATSNTLPGLGMLPPEMYNKPDGMDID